VAHIPGEMTGLLCHSCDTFVHRIFGNTRSPLYRIFTIRTTARQAHTNTKNMTIATLHRAAVLRSPLRILSLARPISCASRALPSQSASPSSAINTAKRTYAQSSLTGGEKEARNAGGTDGAEPRINDSSEPEESRMSEENKKEVERHNEEFEKGHGRAPKAEKDNVDKKLWQGE
jgi:hypothetical protein